MNPSPVDILILGSGPAALVTAVACAERGLRAASLAPDFEGPWRPTYGAWEDELSGLLPADEVQARWREAVVNLPDASITLPRTYVRIDKLKLQHRLMDQASRLGVARRGGRAAGVRHEATGAVVTDGAGREHAARVVVDCTGAGSTLVKAPAGPAPAQQVAFGQLLRVHAHPYPLHQMGWMDWRREGLPEDGAPPSFLYTMPLAADLLFLEETSLASDPPVSLGALRTRLNSRIAALKLEVIEVVEEEHCRIPMNAPRPLLGQRTLAMGAAAGLVHPATGYTLVRSLIRAPRLADALAAGLGRGDPLDAVSAAGWRAVYPPGSVAADDLHRFGLERLLSLDHAGTVAFFRAFFQLPTPAWSAYLAADAQPTPILAAMARTWFAADPRTRLGLLQAGLGRAPLFLSAVTPSFGGSV